MIDLDFRIALRSINRNKVQSAISILGLGIGLGCIILLQALIIHETSFDRFVPDYQNVYKITFGQTCYSQFPLGEEMKKDFPEVKDYFRINQLSDFQLRNAKNELVNEQYFAFSDPSIYSILGIKLIAGTSANTPSEVAISEKMAARYFGNTSPLGTILKVRLNNDFINLYVSGIYKDFPSNSTLFPEFIADLKLTEDMFAEHNKNSLGEYGSGISTSLNWNNQAFYTYVVLDKNADKQVLTSKMGEYRILISDEKAKQLTYNLQPVSESYLKSGDFLDGGYQFFRTGNSNELKYYWSISFLILLISVTNYIFLTKAITSERLREMGTRKVLGASQNNLRRQIILESILVTLLSLIPAAFVIESGMLFINNALNRTLTNEVFFNPVMWLALISVVMFTGTMAGLSIGYNVSRIHSLSLLSGQTSEKSKSKKWSYSFLIFYFSIYIILVVSVITVTKQIRYSLTNLKGINPNNILISDLNSPALKSSFMAVCNEMEEIPGVERAAGSSFVPPFNYFIPINLANQNGDKIRFDGLIMGEGMTEMLDINIIDGSPFGTFQTERIEVLFNESSASKYNIKVGDNYLGVFRVKGIVKDFHSHSLHTLIQPMVILQQNPTKMSLLAIKTDGSNDEAVIKRLRELYNQIAPEEIFEVRYLTDQINDFYSYEKNQAKLIGAFSILATVLAVMGLFGIALISIAKKTKEIGVRKVNGATVFEVIYLLNKDFVKWVLISIIIGVPVSFYLVSDWQNRFAYKTGLSWWIFAIAGISAILVAVLTVSWQSWKAATRNPIESLRYE